MPDVTTSYGRLFNLFVFFKEISMFDKTLSNIHKFYGKLIIISTCHLAIQSNLDFVEFKIV